MPQANSTTSWPRATSPAASESTLPCSAVMIAASSPARSLSSSRKRKTTWVRAATEVAAQPGAAAAALAMTRSASAVEARATRPVTSPVAGLVTSAVRSEEPAKAALSSQWATGAVMGPACRGSVQGFQSWTMDFAG